MSVSRVDRWMRAQSLPVIGRIENDLFMMDARTVQEDELTAIAAAFERLLEESKTQ